MIKVSLIILAVTLFPLLGTEVSAQTPGPQIISQAKTNIRELPRTGLPFFALGLAAILPAGLILKKISGKNKAGHCANSVWNERQLK